MAQSFRFSVSRLPLYTLLAVSLAAPAFAQTPDQTPPPKAETAARDVVVVTANKREESIQDVPIAITAVTSEQRDEQGIITTMDLTNVTPGLSYSGSSERAFLRGIGRNTNNFGAEPGVANYTDGVYESFASISGRDSIFIDRIEVLRGPQGTLYGRNAIGGIINTISKRPTDDFQAELHVAAGNYDAEKVAGSVSGPIFGDALKGRAVAVREVRKEGFYDNLGTGDSEGYQIDNYFLEGQLSGSVGENFEWWTKYTTGRYHNAGPPGGRTGSQESAPYNVGSYNASGTGFNPTFAYSGNPALVGYTQDGTTTVNPALTDLRQLNTNVPQVADLNGYDDAAIEMTYHAPSFDVKYTGGYVFYEYDQPSDYDGSAVKSVTYRAIPSVGAFVPVPGGTSTVTVYPYYLQDYHENRAFFSNEINIISTTDGPIQWIAGLYQYQENFNQPIEITTPNDPANAAVYDAGVRTRPGGRTYYTNNTGLNNAYGIYGQVDWQFQSTLKATVGLRYSYDQKHIVEEDNLTCYIVCSTQALAVGGIRYVDITSSIFTGVSKNEANVEVAPRGVLSSTPTNLSGVTHDATTGLSRRVLGDTFDAVTGTAGLTWTPNSDTLVFGKYSRGYKAGGFNAANMAPNPETNPETLDAFELGLKETFGFHLTSNIDAFYYIYKDAQTPLTVVPPLPAPRYTAFVNVPEAHVWGIELENHWSPIADLDIGFNYAYLDSEYSKSDAYANPLTGVVESLKGNQLPWSPKNKASINVLYDWVFGDGSSLTPSVTWSWRDKQTFSPFNDSQTWVDGYDQTDLRFTWNSAGGHFTWIAWGRNIFDQTGYESVSASRRTTSVAETFTPGAPTTAGGIYQTFTLTPPATFGVEFQFHWK